MEFRLLGPLEARVAGEAVTLGGAKQRGVLAVLLLRADEVVPVERLIDEIWATARPRLRLTASRPTSRGFGSCSMGTGRRSFVAALATRSSLATRFSTRGSSRSC